MSSPSTGEADGDGDVNNRKTWTFTFSESVENHKGMQILGTRANCGFSLDELKAAATAATAATSADLKSAETKTELIALEAALPMPLRTEKTGAWLLVLRGGLNRLLPTEQDRSAFLAETRSFDSIVDKKAFMYGRVVDKRARWNLCFADSAQEPDYEAKKGRVVPFRDTPMLSRVRAGIHQLLGDKARGLKAELNYYYDVTKCGIGWHGDGERRIVVGLRVGATMDLKYQWFHKGLPVGSTTTVTLNGGDLYAMSDKAVGFDWHTRTMPTLRHAAGAPKFVALPTAPKAASAAKTKSKSKRKASKSQKGGPTKRPRHDPYQTAAP